jgi:hypothetical protein
MIESLKPTKEGMEGGHAKGWVRAEYGVILWLGSFTAHLLVEKSTELLLEPVWDCT